MRIEKTFCFYSTETECYWEWIRCSICEIGEYSPGLFFHTLEWFQFSETGVPGIWFHFICWQRGQSWSRLPAEKCKPDRSAPSFSLSLSDTVPRGSSMYMCGKYRERCTLLCSLCMKHDRWYKRRGRWRWHGEMEREHGASVRGRRGCDTHFASMQIHNSRGQMPLQPSVFSVMASRWLGEQWHWIWSGLSSSVVIVSNGAGLFCTHWNWPLSKMKAVFFPLILITRVFTNAAMLTPSRPPTPRRATLLLRSLSVKE